jgi:dihydroorotate dehydrogenase electron transfer subunit
MMRAEKDNFFIAPGPGFWYFSRGPETAMMKDPEARIANVERWGNYRLFSIETPEVAGRARPGQFLMIKVSSQLDPLLRRPISIHARENGRVEIFFQVAGRGTEILAGKEAGDTLDIIGPLGKGFSLDERLKGMRVLCVGGGRGIAPIYFLAKELCAIGALPVVLYGGKTAADIPLRAKFEEAGLPVLCSTDNGSFGFMGFVTGLAAREIEAHPPAFLFACGPDAMMKTAARLSGERNVPAEFSLESRMGCGIGACWGCVKRIRREGQEGWVKICEEGPVFPHDEIVWPEED